MSFLLDTNVVSEPTKPNPDHRVRAWLEATKTEDRYISVLVLGEIRRGIEGLRRRDPRRAQTYESWLRQLNREHAGRIVPVTAEIAEEWGRTSVPAPIPPIDGLMAATAKVRGWTFVTRNIGALGRTGVSLLNPFEG